MLDICKNYININTRVHFVVKYSVCIQSVSRNDFRGQFFFFFFRNSRLKKITLDGIHLYENVIWYLLFLFFSHIKDKQSDDYLDRSGKTASYVNVS